MIKSVFIRNGKLVVGNSNLHVKELFYLLADGKTVDEIAKMYGLRISVVARLLRKLGQLFDEWNPKEDKRI